MAAHTLSISAQLVERMVPSRSKRVSALFAMRRGLQSLVTDLGKEQDNAGDEETFGRALRELWALDERIMTLPPLSVADLKVQAEVVAFEVDDELISPHVAKLLSHIKALKW